MIRYVRDFRALLSGYRQSDDPDGTPAIVTFTFLDGGALPSRSDLPYAVQDVVAMTAAQRDGARAAIAEVAAASGVTFVEVERNADIRLHAVNGSAYGGWGSYPLQDYPGYGQSLVFDNSSGRIERGTFGYDVIVHEIGHNLGLKHPFAGGIRLARDIDDTDRTVMAYEFGDAPLNGLRPMDRAALAALYGDAAADAGYVVRWNAAQTRMDVAGTRGDDDISGAFTENRILAGSGDDRVWGHARADVILAGAGNDVVHADRGDNAVYGGGGADSLFGEDGSGLLDGGAGSDVLSGGATGPSTLRGGTGGDVIIAAGERDVVIGGGGDDAIGLRNGSNTRVQFGTGAGKDLVREFDPFSDTILSTNRGLGAGELRDRLSVTADGLALTISADDVLTLVGLTARDIAALDFTWI